MSAPILATKLYLPPTRPKIVLRPHLTGQLNDGLHRKLTLISAPAGFGKTTLVCEWVAGCGRPAAWLSLDAGDNDPLRFLTYLVAALQTINGDIGKGMSAVLQSPQPPPVESMLTTLLNEIVAMQGNFVLVLDDYHVIDAKAVDHAINFLIEHLPPQMHLVITTREDPNLFLPRLRARDQLTELRVTDMRFTSSEAAEFLNQVMGLNLTTENIASLETRTEGWIAGLQLAAIALQGPMSTHGYKDASSFIKSFSGSHHFVMDYLLQEVLGQQSESVQKFLLSTSILDRMCGPLCDVLLLNPTVSGQETLEYIEHVNLFIVPLDNDRRWYRYHHLFADLLRQRLHQSTTLFNGDAKSHINELHIRASKWYEDNGLEIEAFHHAAAGNDIDRTQRLIEGKGILLHDRGVVTAILKWLESLPATVLNDRPWLWWKYGSLLLANGQTTGVEEKMQAAEAALQGAEANDKTRNLIGQIAAARATVALTRYQVETMLIQSNRALEYLSTDNLPYRATANWALGYAYLFQGDRPAARHALTEAISLGQACGDIFTIILATIGLGNVREGENQLHLAAETYRRVLQLAGDQPLQIISEAHLGLARVLYEWNDLDGAEQHGQQGLHLSRQYEKVIDRFILCEIFLARVKLTHGDAAGALAILAQAEQSARQPNFVHRVPEVVAAQVLTLLHLDDLTTAARLIEVHELPIMRARVHLAQGDTSAALAVLEPLRGQMEARGWADEQLKLMVLQAVTFHAHGEKDKAAQLMADALTLAEPGGFIRIFVDEGLRMTVLLSEAAAQGVRADYVNKLLAVLKAEKQKGQGKPALTSNEFLVEPLSPRELEVLQLIAQGLSNDEISQRLFLALSTVKGHNRIIFGKLQVQRRTEAVARARELGLL
jgi:LuxR family transcriptional regulator, maltose regulon positive regulatory protein